jgi:alkylhydroperoxidase family enzyme
MTRIKPVDEDTADPATAELLNSVRKSMGAVPNLIATMARSPAVARAYLGFARALAGGSLPRRLREKIALVVGEANACGPSATTSRSVLCHHVPISPL